MSIYTISDLHLSLSIDKPMDVFGTSWENYMERLRLNWNDIVKTNDTVIIGGDVSWATYLGECEKDFGYIHSLNGKKIILKGNHDYWWESISKLNNYVSSNGFESISFLYNNSYNIDGIAICGTRGWIDPSYDSFKSDDEKIYLRELARLELSLQSAQKFDVNEKYVFLHYPPVTKDLKINEDYGAMFKKYGVSKCFYGHLHAKASKNALEKTVSDIEYKLVSSDYLRFIPYKIT